MVAGAFLRGPAGTGLAVLLGLLGLALILGLPVTADNPPTATIDSIDPNPAYQTQAVTFVGHGSDSDGNITAYQWSSDLEGLLSNQPSFDLSGLSVGTHTLSFRVRDDAGQWSDNATASLTVQANDPPAPDSLEPAGSQVYRNATLTLAANATDDADALADLTPQYVYLPPDTPEELWYDTVGGVVFSMDMSTDGEYVVAGSLEGKVWLYGRTSNTPLWTFTADDDVYTVTISADGNYLAAGDKAGKVYLFEKGSSTPLWEYLTGGAVRGISLSGDGRYLAAGSTDNNVYLFGRDSNASLWNYTTGGDVLAVALASNGDYVVAGSTDRKVYLFDRATGDLEWTPYETGSTVASVDIARTGMYLVAGSIDDRVYLFSKSSGSPLWYDTTSGDINSVSISENGWYLAAGSADDSVYFYKRDNSTPRWSRATGGDVNAVRVSADSNYIVAGSGDDNLYLFGQESSTPLLTLDANSAVYSVALSRQGAILADGTLGRRVHLLQRYRSDYLAAPYFADGKWQADFEPPVDATLGDYEFWVRFTDTKEGVGDWLAASSQVRVLNNQPVAYLDLLPESPAFTTQTVSFEGHGTDVEGPVAAYQWSSDLDGSLSSSAAFNITGLSAGNHSLTFRVQDGDGVWSEYAQGNLEVLENDPPNATSLNLSADQVFLGQTLYLYANSTDDWDSEGNLTPLFAYRPPGIEPQVVNFTADSSVTAVDLSGNGLIMVAGAQDGWLHLLEGGDNTTQWSYYTGGAVNTVAMASQEDYLMAGSQANRAYFFDRNNSQPLWSYYAGSAVTSVDLSPDAQAAAVGTQSYRVAYFTTNSGSPRWTYTAGGRINQVAVNLDGSLIVAASNDDKFYVFEAPSSTPFMTYNAGADVQAIDIGGAIILSGTADNMVYTHYPDLATDPPAFWEYNVSTPVNSVAISNDEDILAVGTAGGEIFAFEANETGESYLLLWRYDTGSVVNTVTLSENGAFVMAGTENGTVYYFNATNSTPLWIQNLTGGVNSVALSSDGELQAAGSSDQKAYYYDRWAAHYIGPATFVDGYWRGTFTAPAMAATGNYSFRVRFADPQGATGRWYYTNETIELVEGPPVAVIDSIDPDPAYDAFNVRFIGHGEDPRDPIVAYEWRSDLEGVLSTDPDFNVTGLTVGTHTLTFRVRDGDDQWSFNTTYLLEVRHYQTPNATDVNPADPQVLRGDSLKIWANATDDEVAEADLTVEFEYQPLEGGDGEWNASYLATPNYSGDAWQVTFDPPLEAVRGNYSLRVRFSDGRGWSEWRYNNGSLEVANRRPSAFIDLVEPNPAEPGEQVNFSGHGLDLDGSIAGYRWRSDMDGVLSDTADFNTTSLSETNHTIYFAVQDELGAWSEEVSYLLTVARYIPPPTAHIDLIAPNPVNLGERVFIEGHGTTEEGNITAHRWRSDRQGLLSTQAAFNTTSLEAGRHNISLRVKSSDNLWSEWTWQFLTVNALPTATIIAITPDNTIENEPVNFLGLGEDSDGAVEEYEWRSNHTEVGVFGTEPDFNYQFLPVGLHNITLRVKDDLGAWSQPANATLLVRERPPSNNQDPTATILYVGPDPTIVGQPVTFNGSGSDPDGTIVEYRWESSLDGDIGSVANFNYSGLSLGQHTITLRVRDNGSAWSSAATTLNITENQAPTAQIMGVSPNPAHPWELVTLNGSGIDSDGRVAAYEWSSNIEGLLGNSSQVVVTNLTLGLHNLSLRVQDNLGLWSAPTTIVLNITENQAPIALIETHEPDLALLGEPVTFEGDGNDSDGQVVAYEWSSNFDGVLGQSAALTITNLTLGPHTISFRVQDDDGEWSESVSFAMVVVKPNEPPLAVLHTSIVTAYKGDELDFEGEGRDKDGFIIAYEWKSSIDDLFGFEAQVKYANLSVGNHTIYFRVQDDDLAWSEVQSFELTIKAKPSSTGPDSEGGGYLGLSTFMVMLLAVAGVMVGGGGGLAVLYKRRQPGTATGSPATSPAATAGTAPPKEDKPLQTMEVDGEEIPVVEAVAVEAVEEPDPESGPASEPSAKKQTPEPESSAASQSKEPSAAKAAKPAPPAAAAPETVTQKREMPELPDSEGAKAEAPAKAEQAASPFGAIASKAKAADKKATAASAMAAAARKPGTKPPTRKGTPAAAKAKGPAAKAGTKPSPPTKAPGRPAAAAKARPRAKKAAAPFGGAAAKPATKPKLAAKPKAKPTPATKPAAAAQQPAAPATAKPPSSEQIPTATIECPQCKARMHIPKLGKLQKIKCKSCGLEGDLKV